MSEAKRPRTDTAESTETPSRGPRTASATTTRGIRIDVRSEFLPERSSPRDGSYLFQYDVRISNVGTETAQLISREWIITNADGEVERVKGPGVIGEQPVLPPGCHTLLCTYRSDAPLVFCSESQTSLSCRDFQKFAGMV